MEFFLPSLLTLILAALVVFFVLPKFAPIVLAVIALLALVLGAYQHYEMFKMDYRMMTWQDGASTVAPYILIGFIVLYIIGFLLNIYKSRSPIVQTTIASNTQVPGFGSGQPPQRQNVRPANGRPANVRPQNGRPQSLIF